MNNDSLIKIKSQLPRGWVEKTCKETKKSPSLVQKVMNPKYRHANTEILRAAVRLAKLTKEDRKKLEDELKSI